MSKDRCWACVLPVIFGRSRLSKTSCCTFGHDHIYMQMPKQAVTNTQTKKYMERERGRKSYFVHNMGHDVATHCSERNTIATKPVSGGRKITNIRTRSHRGNAPYDFDTGIVAGRTVLRSARFLQSHESVRAPAAAAAAAAAAGNKGGGTRGQQRAALIG